MTRLRNGIIPQTILSEIFKVPSNTMEATTQTVPRNRWINIQVSFVSAELLPDIFYNMYKGLQRLVERSFKVENQCSTSFWYRFPCTWLVTIPRTTHQHKEKRALIRYTTWWPLTTHFSCLVGRFVARRLILSSFPASRKSCHGFNRPTIERTFPSCELLQL